MKVKITLAVVAVFAVAMIAILQMAQISNRLSSTVVARSSTASAGGALDTTGWTANEKMNYEMHGTIPARIQQSAGSRQKGPAMVGGC